jgi:hypothetical protein
MAPRALLAGLVLALAVAGCGSGSGGGLTIHGQSDTDSVPGNADPADVAVIQNWTAALDQGDIKGAAGYFALPSVTENGPQLLQITDRAEARLFNASLPCGARLIQATDEGDFTVATFRLTERPGPGTCGTGVGHTAQTQFVIKDGLIKEWRRVGIGGPQAPSAST